MCYRTILTFGLYNYNVFSCYERIIMAVPKYDEFFKYVLKCLADNKDHTTKEIISYCADSAGLSDSEKRETLASGTTLYINRIAWARTYLSKAGLIKKTARAVYHITPEGKKAINFGVEKIDLDYLRKYDSFKNFSDKKSQSLVESSRYEDNEKSPLEQIEASINDINSSLQADLMDEILKMSPYDFESLIVKLLLKMGYGTLRQNEDAVTKKSGDEGIDGVVSADKFGFDSIYVQAKKWQTTSTVGRPDIQKFLGALAGQGATKGIFFTTSHFSKEALDFANKQLHQKIILVDGDQLTKLMTEYNLGVSAIETFVIKKVDYDFFNDEI